MARTSDPHAATLKAWQTRARAAGGGTAVQQRSDFAAAATPHHTDPKGRQWEVRYGTLPLVRGKVAVREAGVDGDDWSNWHDSVEDAVAEKDRFRAEREHNEKAATIHAEITKRALARPEALSDADIRTLAGGYPSFSTASAKAWLATAGLKGRDADRILTSPRVGSLGQSRGGANLFDARSVIEEAARRLRARG